MKKSQEKYSASEMRDSRRYEPSSEKTLEMQNDEPTLIVANFNTRNANQRVETVQKNSSSSNIEAFNSLNNMSNDEARRLFENQLRNGFFNQYPPTKVLRVNEEFYIGTIVSIFLIKIMAIKLIQIYFNSRNLHIIVLCVVQTDELSRMNANYVREHVDKRMSRWKSPTEDIANVSWNL